MSEEMMNVDAVDTSVDTGIDNTGIDNTGVDNTGVDNTGVDNADAVDTGVDDTSVDEQQEALDIVNQAELDSAKQVPRPNSDREENLKALRESRKQLQQERDEYFRRVQALEAAQAKASVANTSVDNTSVDEDLDDYLDEDVNQKEIKILKRSVAQMVDSNSRMKLSSQYPDFSKVVTQESIAILKQRFPEIAATLDQSRDIYTTGVSAYNIIKKFGLNIDEEYVSKKENVETNINKPRPVSSLKSTSALSYARDYSDLSDKSTRAEIIRIATERAGG